MILTWTGKHLYKKACFVPGQSLILLISSFIENRPSSSLKVVSSQWIVKSLTKRTKRVRIVSIIPQSSSLNFLEQILRLLV